MTSLFKGLFSQPSLSTSGKAPSFNDFSMHVGDDAEHELGGIKEAPSGRCSTESNSSETNAAENPRPRRTNIWQDTFSPQMNSNMRHPRGDFYDKPTKGGKTVWEQIIKADHVRHATFDHFDTNKDGVIDAADLRAHLGADANVEELIRQADKNKDGKIDQAEFCELLKSM